MAMGRPPKFETPELLEAAFEDWKKLFEDGNSLHDEIPDVEGFCVYVGAYRDLLFAYEKKEDFSDTIKTIKTWIYYKKKQLAMQNKMPPAIFIFDAKNNAGYVDRIDTDVTSAGQQIGELGASQAEQLIRARSLRDKTDS